MNGALGPTRRRAVVAVVATALGLGALTPTSVAAPTSDAGSEPPGTPTVHSSDGLAGPLAATLPRARSATVVRTDEKSYRVVPGVRFRQWDQTDVRGTVRVHLLRADLQQPGVSLRYAGLPKVTARDELTDILRQDKAVAGVNGDFFDIGDTGAPLGVGVDGARVIHGPSSGWLNSFVLPTRGVATVGQLPVRASVRTLPDLGLTNVNSPRVAPNGIGVYTGRWGTAPGYSVTDGARKRDVRQVVIKSGVVVSNTVSVSSGAIEGRVLIGRGDGAVRLNRQLPVGTRAPVTLRTDANPKVAVSGSAVLLQDGVVSTTDDGELHPRTAVGVDTDTGRVLLLVVDGRQEHSRGYTLLELALLLQELGAEEALNLDGGGSSTMVTRRPSGQTRVANSPSDGRQRQVPNGLQLVYRPR